MMSALELRVSSVARARLRMQRSWRRMASGTTACIPLRSSPRPRRTPEQGYHLMEDLADKAIGWIRQQKAIAPDKPFFVYFAPGATHAPHHVPKDWIAKYKGRFDQGWDKDVKRLSSGKRDSASF